MQAGDVAGGPPPGPLLSPPETPAGADLSLELGALARLAEEARWAAEERRHEQLTAHRHAARAAALEVPADVVPAFPAPDDRAAIHAALAEVAAGSLEAAAPAGDGPDRLEEAAAAPLPPPQADYAPDPTELYPVTDTAALLRELTFLGLDDAPGAPAGAARTPLRSVPLAAVAKVKRKGLFGR